MAARVLSDAFDEVTIVERDALGDVASPRKGVPQSRHLHVLLKRGEEVLAELFPGIVETLAQGGAERLDFARDLHWYHWGGWKARFDSDLLACFMTRPFLETEVRRRVLSIPNVRVVDQHDALGITCAEGRVTGLKVRKRDGGAEETLPASLVVDASGRGSQTPKWIEALGYPKPPESTVKIHVGYATRFYERPDPAQFPWKALYILGTPPGSRRLGVIIPVEGGRWAALVAGVLGDHPPDDPDGFLDYAKGLPAPDLHRALLALEPVGDIAIHKFPSNLRRHYEQLTRRIEGLVVVGDALCSFNPIYGQGMTAAALDALTLGSCLREHRQSAGNDLKGLAARFHQEVSRVIDVFWTMTTGEDFRYPEIEGDRPPGYAMMKWYLGRVHEVAKRDTEVTGNFFRAMHMLESPNVLLQPRMVLRMMLG
ncbi:putative secreted protein [Minicystis rosea]|nr:putative secreted protein [Minicystis rosea]